MPEKEQKYHEVYIREILSDLIDVGPEKPLGYLPIDTLKDVCEVDVEDFARTLRVKGLKTIMLNMEESNVGWNGALYAYHEDSLRNLLLEQRELLMQKRWPLDPEAFIRHLNNLAPSKTALFDLVADAFNDKYNTGRTDVEAEPGDTFVYFWEKKQHMAATGFLRYNQS
jgi:hypothetical protein